MLVSRQVSEIIKKYRRSFLLLGPRQTGKSTLISSLKPELTINLADQETYVEFLRDPGQLRRISKNKKTVFIDEVQKIPSLLNTVQALIDETKGQKVFYLTGSSARKLKRGQANLLPGRIVTFELGPLNVSELGPNLDIDRLLSLGALPGMYLETDLTLAKKVLRSYASTYLKEEIQAEALTRNLEGFSRFFEVIASRSGDLTDFSKYAVQASIERTTAKRYYDVLVDTLVGHSIPSFTKSSRRRLIQHPKFYFFDVGVLNGALNNFEVSGDRKGSLFENLCLQMLFSEAKGLDESARISHYRTERGAEVDFILEKESSTWALEIKATKKISSEDFRGLKSFRDFFGKKMTGIIIYLGDREQEFDGFRVLPFQKAFQEIFK